MTNKQAEVVLDRFRPRHKQFILTVFRDLDPFRRSWSCSASTSGPERQIPEEYLFKSDAKSPRSGADEAGCRSTKKLL